MPRGQAIILKKMLNIPSKEITTYVIVTRIVAPGSLSLSPESAHVAL